jgi:hypothetical protein
MTRRDDFLRGPMEKGIEAIRAGRTEEALGHLNDVQEQFHKLHDAYCNHLSLLQGTLFETQGDKWYEAFDRKTVFALFRAKYERWRTMTPEQRIEDICNSHRAHYSQFHVEEDDQKLVVVITGCGAGGRLVRDGIAKRQNSVTRQAYPWSFNQVDFPYYCSHGYHLNALWKELGLKAELQWGRQYNDEGKQIDEPCKYVVYK